MDQSPFTVGDKVRPANDRLHMGVGTIVKMGKRPWADVWFPSFGRVPARYPLKSLVRLPVLVDQPFVQITDIVEYPSTPLSAFGDEPFDERDYDGLAGEFFDDLGLFGG